MSRRTYPPEQHLLRHLRLTHLAQPDGSVTATMPVLEDLLDEGGWLRLGAVATLVDSAAGHHAVRQVTPDWVATLHLGTVLHRAAEGEEIVAECAPLRVGRNNVVSEIRVLDDAGELARSLCTYARLPARADNPSVGTAEAQEIVYRESAELSPRPLLDDYIRLVPRPGEPVLDLEHHGRIHNSFGSIQGGAVVVLMERASTHLFQQVTSMTGRCTAADVHYLAQAKGGPFEVRAELLSRHDHQVSFRVTITDVGHDDRLLSVATTTTIPA